MKSYLGMGTGSAESAVEQATKGIGTPGMILFMASYAQMAEVAESIARRYPDIPSIGTIGTKLVNGTVSDENVAVMGLYEDAVVRCGVIEQISVCPIVSILEVERAVDSVGPGREDTLLLEYCTNNEEKLVTTFTSCLEKRRIKLAGGTVFGAPEGAASVVAYNGRLYEDACVYAVIKNTTGRVRVYKENIYERQSETHHFATKVDTGRKALIELDGRPAADVYGEEIGIPKNQIVDNVLRNPMGRIVGKQVFISSMNGLEPDGTLLNYKQINQNDCIYFLKLGDYKAIEQNTREKIRSEMKSISLVISIDCIYRYVLYSGEGYFDTYAKDMSALGNHIGIISGGEQINNQHVNQTMVCAVFE